MSRFNRQIFFLPTVFISLPVTFLVLISFSAIADEQRNVTLQKAIFIHAQDQCVVCHAGRDDFKAVLIANPDKCIGCHENTNPALALPIATSEKVSLIISEDKPVSVAGRKDHYGMRFPVYTKGTRLGDAANKMVLIPAGDFVMGTDARLPDEGPQHVVSLPDYYIDIFEVTNLQYKKFNDATHGRSPRHWRNRTYPPGKVDHPVVYVTWKNASDYCQWSAKRLPTDQEWEKAARGTTAQTFPWGDEFDSARANTPLRWQEIGKFGDTTPVGSFEKGKSPYGLYDVSGNVWEWTASWYKAYPGNEKASESYGERYKTLKGGSWFDCSFYQCGISAPVYNRAFFAKKVKNDTFGFRCAKDAVGKVK